MSFQLRFLLECLNFTELLFRYIRGSQLIIKHEHSTSKSPEIKQALTRV
jgi:hypothetical protein